MRQNTQPLPKRVAYKISLLCLWRLCFVITPESSLQILTQKQLWKENSVRPTTVCNKKIIAQAHFDIQQAIKGQDRYMESFSLSKLMFHI